jgi:hypothetical protein
MFPHDLTGQLELDTSGEWKRTKDLIIGNSLNGNSSVGPEGIPATL